MILLEEHLLKEDLLKFNLIIKIFVFEKKNLLKKYKYRILTRFSTRFTKYFIKRRKMDL